jgi:hypothetical protein
VEREGAREGEGSGVERWDAGEGLEAEVDEGGGGGEGGGARRGHGAGVWVWVCAGVKAAGGGFLGGPPSSLDSNSFSPTASPPGTSIEALLRLSQNEACLGVTGYGECSA